MGFCPSNGVGLCLVAGRAVFLDIRRDRYFLGSPGASAALQRMESNLALETADRRALEKLVSDGLLRAVSASTKPIGTVVAEPCESFLDRQPGSFGWAAMSAWSDVRRIRRMLRQRGLANAVAALAASRTTYDRRSSMEIVDAATRFASLRSIVNPLDQCLPLSLALCRRCPNADVKLIFGVKLGPFAAHAWVQQGDLVLNDHLETVAPFTPILVV